MRKIKHMFPDSAKDDIYVDDDKGIENVNYKYVIKSSRENAQVGFVTHINFQDGVQEDVNSHQGVTDQYLLEIVKDRLRFRMKDEPGVHDYIMAFYHINQVLFYLDKAKEDE